MDPIIPQILAAVGLLVIPSLALAARFALKPIVDAIIRVKDAFPPPAPAAAPLQEHPTNPIWFEFTTSPAPNIS